MSSRGAGVEALRRSIDRGIAKINFNTELRAAYCGALEENVSAAGRGHDVVALMRHATSAVQGVVKEKLQLLGAAGRA